MVIGKVDDLAKANGWKSGEALLNLNRNSTWTDNLRLLQKAMKQGSSIRDASIGKGGGFLAKERNYLTQKGWKLNEETTYWNPPK